MLENATLGMYALGRLLGRFAEKTTSMGVSEIRMFYIRTFDMMEFYEKFLVEGFQCPVHS